MSKYSIFALVAIVSVTGCTAPQGRKLADNRKLPAVATGPASIATGPAQKAPTLTWSNKGELVTLQRGSTVTAVLQAHAKDGYGWRFSEIPDPTVLKLVSKEYVPSTEPGKIGQEKWVFESTGPGEVQVKLFYGNLRPSEIFYTPTYNFIASVEDRPVKTGKRH